MTVQIKVYEMTGTPGNKVPVEIGNLNFKSTDLVAANYVYYPIRSGNYSFQRYIYFTVIVSGTNISAARAPKLIITQTQTADNGATVSLSYKVKNTFSTPGINVESDMVPVTLGQEIALNVSDTSPELATSVSTLISKDVFYYTNYLMFQATATAAAGTNAGNGPSFNFKFNIKTYE